MMFGWHLALTLKLWFLLTLFCPIRFHLCSLICLDFGGLLFGIDVGLIVGFDDIDDGICRENIGITAAMDEHMGDRWMRKGAMGMPYAFWISDIDCPSCSSVVTAI